LQDSAFFHSFSRVCGKPDRIFITKDVTLYKEVPTKSWKSSGSKVLVWTPDLDTGVLIQTGFALAKIYTL